MSKSKIFHKNFVVLGGLLGFAVHSGDLQAANATRIAVFDMNNAIQTVAEGKAAKETLKKDWESRQAKLKKKEEKIQAAMEEFKKQSLVMDEKARREKENTIRAQMAELQQEGMQASREFQQKDQQLSGPILKKLRQKVAEVGKEKGYNMVLDSNESIVLYFDPQDDLTAEVIKRIDNKKDDAKK